MAEDKKLIADADMINTAEEPKHKLTKAEIEVIFTTKATAYAFMT